MIRHGKHNLSSGLGSPNYGSRTDVGKVRQHNEDSLLVQDPIYAVFDGMGGMAAGEVASEIACSVIKEKAPNECNADQLGMAVEEANFAILQAAKENPEKFGMGTTCTVAIINGEKMIIAQVGDSRLYLLHNGDMQQITRDHSYVADLVEQGKITKDYARVHPDRSKITRALGTDPNMHPDLYDIDITSGDRVLICSDGLYSMISDDDIMHILNKEPDPQVAADRLVKEACAAGGHDNVTVIIVDVSGYVEIKKKKLARKTKITAAFIILLFIGLIIGAFFAYSTIVNTNVYLGTNGDKVAIYGGFPDNSTSNSEVKENTNIKLEDLDQNIQERIKNKEITCSNIEEAHSILDNYKENIKKKEEEQKKLEESTKTDESQDNKQESQ